MERSPGSPGSPVLVALALSLALVAVALAAASLALAARRRPSAASDPSPPPLSARPPSPPRASASPAPAAAPAAPPASSSAAAEPAAEPAAGGAAAEEAAQRALEDRYAYDTSGPVRGVDATWDPTNGAYMVYYQRGEADSTIEDAVLDTSTARFELAPRGRAGRRSMVLLELVQNDLCAFNYAIQREKIEWPDVEYSEVRDKKRFGLAPWRGPDGRFVSPIFALLQRLDRPVCVAFSTTRLFMLVLFHRRRDPCLFLKQAPLVPQLPRATLPALRIPFARYVARVVRAEVVDRDGRRSALRIAPRFAVFEIGDANSYFPVRERFDLAAEVAARKPRAFELVLENDARLSWRADQFYELRPLEFPRANEYSDQLDVCLVGSAPLQFRYLEFDLENNLLSLGDHPVRPAV